MTFHPRIQYLLNGCSREPLTNRQTAYAVIGACAALSLLLPSLALEMALVAMAAVFVQIHIAPPRHGLAHGVLHLGNDVESGEEIWLDSSKARQHVLVLGHDDEERRNVMTGLAGDALAWSSGFVLVDGSPGSDVVEQVSAMAHDRGRSDDVLVIDFARGNAHLRNPNTVNPFAMTSNTFNPFSSSLSSDAMTQTLVSLMDDSGDGAMWKGKATAMMTGLMRALAWLRDEGRLDLNVGTIRDYLNLKAIVDLADPAMHPDMPASVRKSMRSYLTSLPGYQEEKGYKQSQTTLDQHGWLEMQFTKILGSLADVYGDIFFCDDAAVDMVDVLRRRRILVVRLPTLESSPDEIATTAKFVVAALKASFSWAYGSTIKGTWEEIVDKRPSHPSSPFLVCLNDVAYYTVDGMALMHAVARGQGVGFVSGVQDIPALKRLDEKEAASILANTNTKIFLGPLDAPKVAAEADRVIPRPGVGESLVLQHEQVVLVETIHRQPSQDEPHLNHLVPLISTGEGAVR